MNAIDHVSQATEGLKPFPDRLHVVTVIVNPRRYWTRYELYRGFKKHMRDSGVELYTCEIQNGGRCFEITDPNNSHDIQLRTDHVLWHKENGLNLLINRLPLDAKYIAWIDADITFVNPRWAQDTLHALQHYDLVQPWSHAQDLTHNYELLGGGTCRVQESMCYHLVNGAGWDKKFDVADLEYYNQAVGHPGYAWAARRSALDKLGGLFDQSICGANDRHMAFGLFGKIRNSVHPKMSPAFLQALDIWENRALKLKYNVGYVPGLILHHWHGNKKNRRYVDRWQILVQNEYDPYTDIYRDTQGLYQLTEQKPRLRDDLRQYFAQRNEDALFEPV